MSPGIPKDAWDNPRCPTRGEYVCLGYYVVIHRYLGHLYIYNLFILSVL